MLLIISPCPPLPLQTAQYSQLRLWDSIGPFSPLRSEGKLKEERFLRQVFCSHMKTYIQCLQNTLQLSLQVNCSRQLRQLLGLDEIPVAKSGIPFHPRLWSPQKRLNWSPCLAMLCEKGFQFLERNSNITERNVSGGVL